MHVLIFALSLLVFGGGAARACQVALLLSIDVSQSIDVAEYRIQTEGLADAVLDPDVAEALLRGQVMLSVVQWSGPEAQAVTIPWTQMTSDADIQTFSQRARGMERAFSLSNTAVGAMLSFAARQFDAVPHCARHVIDVSGDGNDNAETSPEQARREAEARGIQINALAIEGIGRAITNFYTRSVITRNGFVMTSQGHTPYADTLRRKIRREVSQVMF